MDTFSGNADINVRTRLNGNDDTPDYPGVSPCWLSRPTRLAVDTSGPLDHRLPT